MKNEKLLKLGVCLSLSLFLLAACSSSFVIKGEKFKVDEKYNGDCETDVSIVSTEHDGFLVSGSVSTDNNGYSSPWCLGAKHTWKGKFVYADYIFASDENEPLQFVVTSDGYRYVGGKGTVTLPDGSIVSLNTQEQAKIPAQPQPSGKQYSAAPPMTIDVTKKYTATFKMAKGGEFVVQLYPDKAPITVNNFVFLARDGYFNGVTFHRVLEGFMAQGGDPTGTGMGGPGYEFINEDSDLTFDRAGVVAMANAGRDTNGSQFFITFAPAPQLNGGYTIFGQVISGMDVVMDIRLRDPQQNPSYAGDAIGSVTIEEK